jgi:hypothetical protein
MIAPKNLRQSKRTDAHPKSATGIAMMLPPVSSQDKIWVEKISARAYELYERRGREPGNAEQDWLRAEREILQTRR